MALIDIDNFTLVNDTYGHASGDRALRQIAREIQARLPEGSIAGRYGPDEYLVLSRAASASELAAVVQAVQVSLAAQSLDVEATERLPITISAGIAVYPDHASSATALLSVVAVELAAAKASGGDATRIAGDFGEAPALAGGFDILQGLVFAVDTKDRYTKRHSEDVARYGVFLARLLKLDPELIEGIKTAGLLHDVGKIGIPDSVLRKPGRLTAEENEIVKQHVALGDSIVRNVDRIDLVRAGIRHHHERWDGRGYLDALAGEDIPLVARILAVADAFSAMTTTRPYRKALSIEEALRRLGDAAGTQLDERLAGAFIHGIETVADAPLPDEAGVTVDPVGPARPGRLTLRSGSRARGRGWWGVVAGRPPRPPAGLAGCGPRVAVVDGHGRPVVGLHGRHHDRLGHDDQHVQLGWLRLVHRVRPDPGADRIPRQHGDRLVRHTGALVVGLVLRPRA